MNIAYTCTVQELCSNWSCHMSLCTCRYSFLGHQCVRMWPGPTTTAFHNQTFRPVLSRGQRSVRMKGRHLDPAVELNANEVRSLYENILYKKIKRKLNEQWIHLFPSMPHINKYFQLESSCSYGQPKVTLQWSCLQRAHR